MKKVRNNCFESNSSSMHTVTVRGKKKIVDYNYIHDGVITITLDEYGWNGDPCDDFLSKLRYAMSMVLHTEYPGFEYYDESFCIDQEVLEGLPGYELLINAIHKHSGCKQIVVKKRNSYYPYGYIDHQSYEHYNSLSDFLNDYNVDAERFLYDDGVVVWIDNDNH